MTPKRCVQCGILKQPSDFRKYTYSVQAKTDGRYRICKECEALNTRYRRAMERGDAATFERITGMYRALEALGYRTPLSAERKDSTVTNDIVDRILTHHGVTVESVVKRDPDHDKHPKEEATVVFYHGDGTSTAMVSTIVRPLAEVPEELQYWLDVDMAEWTAADLSPEYLQETIYESLKAKYRPQTGVDKDLYIPTYDDTYKEVLNQILRRFDDYEETYSSQSQIGEPTDNVDEDIIGDD